MEQTLAKIFANIDDACNHLYKNYKAKFIRLEVDEQPSEDGYHLKIDLADNKAYITTPRTATSTSVMVFLLEGEKEKEE